MIGGPVPIGALMPLVLARIQTAMVLREAELLRQLRAASKHEVESAK